MLFLYLASRSPRRRELLTQAGIPFRLLDIDVDESVLMGEAPEVYVERLARAKAKAGLLLLQQGSYGPSAPVLSADTTVALDGHILSKPADADEAVAMLMRLSGKEHLVHTGIALCSAERILSQVVTTKVRFANFSQQQIERYVATGESMDKAGAYGIQGYGGVLVESLTGSYSNVVGLPVRETAELASQFGVSCWQTGSN